MRIKYLQKFFKSAYDYSCFADCIIKLACKITGTEHNLTNIGKALDIGFDKGYLSFNQDDYANYDNFTVQDSAAFLSALTGKKFVKETKGRGYVPGPGEYEVQFWAKTEENGRKGIGHFILPDYDPLENSQTKKVGFIYSKRIFREVK